VRCVISWLWITLIEIFVLLWIEALKGAVSDEPCVLKSSNELEHQ
jgi:hypothetical protein